ncbi:translation initiation factor eIF-2B subunit alpha, putative [Eimeria brunetti]|uniref:Translation initiation factor eIF-2B subunit alpha, putative n=1 Tax=Eimeria brunetti TaxID=51314 RepID=U6LAV5_9EIME|nr:translation initiation factor eIF-2B subunit alpha, putative [Eimeria brunetti]
MSAPALPSKAALETAAAAAAAATAAAAAAAARDLSPLEQTKHSLSPPHADGRQSAAAAAAAAACATAAPVDVAATSSSSSSSSDGSSSSDSSCSSDGSCSNTSSSSPNPSNCSTNNHSTCSISTSSSSSSTPSSSSSSSSCSEAPHQQQQQQQQQRGLSCSESSSRDGVGSSQAVNPSSSSSCSSSRCCSNCSSSSSSSSSSNCCGLSLEQHVVDSFWRCFTDKQNDLALAAVHALATVVHASRAESVLELFVHLQGASEALADYVGRADVLEYIAKRTCSVAELKTLLIAQSAKFASRISESKQTIADLGRIMFTKDQMVVLTHGRSSCVEKLLCNAWKKHKKRFVVIITQHETLAKGGGLANDEYKP